VLAVRHKNATHDHDIEFGEKSTDMKLELEEGILNSETGGLIRMVLFVNIIMMVAPDNSSLAFWKPCPIKTSRKFTT
jgi:hypothetical protein